MKINNFREMSLWKDTAGFAVKVYKITDDSKFNKDFALKEQIRKSVISIPSNIAEGFERQNNNEFIVFLRIAKASCAELLTQLYIAKEIGRIHNELYLELETISVNVSRKIGGFIAYLKSKKSDKEFILK